MLPSFATQQVTILNPGKIVEGGHEVDDWDNPTSTTVRCVWEAATTAQSGRFVGSIDTILGMRTLYLIPGAPVTGRSRIRFPNDQGRDWQVVGEPALNRSPTGAVSNVTVNVRRWEAVQ